MTFLKSSKKFEFFFFLVNRSHRRKIGLGAKTVGNLLLNCCAFELELHGVFLHLSTLLHCVQHGQSTLIFLFHLLVMNNIKP